MRTVLLVAGVLCFFLFLTTLAYAQDTATLTVRSRYGSPDPPVGTHTYPLVPPTEITASVATPVAGTPGIRYVCTGWRARGSPETLAPTGEGNSVTFTITMNTTLTWTWKTQYLLTTTATPEGSGTVDVSPTSTDGYYDAKSTVRLTASDNTGYDFGYWSGGLRGITNPQDLLLRGPRNVVATFIPEHRYLTVSIDPSPSCEPDPPVGTHDYYYSDTVSANCGVNPYPEGEGIRSVCTGHSGTGDVTGGSGTSISFIIYVDSSVTWTWQIQYYLTIDSLYGAPVGAGWYDSGATANWSVTSPWPGGTGIQYVASPASGSVLMDSAKTVTVTWTMQYYLTANVSPGGAGTINCVPPGPWYNTGASVELTANANGGYTWSEWTGALTGTTNPQSLTMDAPKSVTANFVGNPTLTVNNPGGYDTPVPAVGTYSYPPGTSVTCSMTASEWYDPFTEGFESGNINGWTTGVDDGTAVVWSASTASKYSGTYGAQAGIPDRYYVCYIQRTFTIGAGGGTVSWWWKFSRGASSNYMRMRIDGVQMTQSNTSSTAWANVTGISVGEGTHTLRWELYRGSSTAPSYMYLDDITIINVSSASATTKYICAGYTGTGSCLSGSGTTVTFTITTASSITWNWTTQFKLTTSVTPAGWGSVSASPSQEWYDSGASVELTASPALTFANWSGGLTGSTNPATITMDAPKNITANFSPLARTLVITSAHGSPSPPVGTRTYNYGQSVTGSVPSPEFELVSGTFTEGFESGTPQWWVLGGARIGSGNSSAHTGYAAVLSAVADNCYSYMERTFIIAAGGGEITFWWKVSSESGGDYLRFYIDGVEQVSISGEVAWESRTFSLAEGTRTIRWAYTKNYYLSAGTDRGWVDDITITNTDSGTFTEGFETYDPTPPLPGWTVDGTSPAWLRTSAYKHGGTYSLQSPDIGDSPDYFAYTSTYIERKFTIGEGGGTVLFWWKVSSETNYDFLEFYIDGVLQSGRISGEVDWSQKGYPLSAGTHTLKWRYTKDMTISTGSDCGWVDDIQVTNTGYPAVNYFCTGYTGTGSCPSGSGTTVTFTITVDSSITWLWKTMYVLAVGVDPSASGTVDISPTSSNGYYDVDAGVTLTANPSTDYLFGQWTGDLTGNSNPATITMNGPKIIVAHFVSQNKPSNLTAVATDISTIRWSWTSNNNDWQGIAAGVLRTVAATLDPFWATYYDVPPDETCPRTGTGNDRLLFEATDDLPLEGTQDCPTIDASWATTYTIKYTRDSDSTWHCTADTYLTNLYDYYIDQTGVLKRAMSTGDGSQAIASSSVAPDNVWFEIQDSFDASVGTVYPNITLWQETGLSENTQYTRHVHAVNGSTYSDPTNSVGRYTLIHDATLTDFSLAVGTSTKVKLVGEGDEHRTGGVSKRYPIDIAYNYARCQMLLYGSDELWEDYYGVWRPALDEIGQGGISAKITRIRFQRASGDEDNVNVSEIYMVHTNEGMLPQTWTDTTSHTLVYSGNLVIPSGDAGTWYEITLTNPFLYDGHSNLIISFWHHDGSGETTYTQWMTTAASRVSGNAGPKVGQSDLGGRCVAFYGDTDPPETSEEPDWGFGGQAATHFPNIKLVFEKGGVTVTVTPPANSTSGYTGVWVERAPDDSFTTGTVTVQGFTPIYTVTDTPPTPGTWWYRIRFQNGDGYSSAYSNGTSAVIPPY